MLGETHSEIVNLSKNTKTNYLNMFNVKGSKKYNETATLWLRSVWEDKEMKNVMQSILNIFYELKSGHVGGTHVVMVLSGYSYNIYVLHLEVETLSNL